MSNQSTTDASLINATLQCSKARFALWRLSAQNLFSSYKIILLLPNALEANGQGIDIVNVTRSNVSLVLAVTCSLRLAIHSRTTVIAAVKFLPSFRAEPRGHHV